MEIKVKTFGGETTTKKYDIVVVVVEALSITILLFAGCLLSFVGGYVLCEVNNLRVVKRSTDLTTP